jgi:raffinose/stachyose/melibiose transport system permease protein
MNSKINVTETKLPIFVKPVTKALKGKKVALFSFMILISIAQIFPLIWLINFSFLKSGDFFGSSFLKWPEKWEWENYINAFSYGGVPKYFLNSFIVTMATVIITAILSLMLGYAFTRMRWKFKTAVMNFMMLGLIIPIHATLLPNFIIFNELNMLDNLYALILPYVAFSLPQSMYIMTGFMESIPKEVEESAVMDGCGIFGIIFRIMLPMTKPAIATICVLNFITWWNEFIMANTFLVSDEFKTLPFSIMKFTGQYSSNYGAQFAVMTLIAIPSILMFIFFSKQMTKGITSGAVKG